MPGFTGSAHADFSHTAILTGVQARDAQSSLIPDITISAESGTQYPLSPVPEPASAALMAIGAGILAWRQRTAVLSRRRRQHLLG